MCYRALRRFSQRSLHLLFFFFFFKPGKGCRSPFNGTFQSGPAMFVSSLSRACICLIVDCISISVISRSFKGEARYFCSHLCCLRGSGVGFIALNLEALHLERCLEVDMLSILFENLRYYLKISLSCILKPFRYPVCCIKQP